MFTLLAVRLSTISIHALRKESDDGRAVFNHLSNNFNPRSP